MTYIHTIYVIAESANVFRRYFNPAIFKYFARPEYIRGLCNTTVIKFGRYWRNTAYDNQLQEIEDYCKLHSISFLIVQEPNQQNITRDDKFQLEEEE